jgi:hypothetical protein
MSSDLSKLKLDTPPEDGDDSLHRVVDPYQVDSNSPFELASPTHSSVSGLSDAHRSHARSLAKSAALLGYNHRDLVHYTQSVRRWDGINKDFKAYQGEYPKYADCSAYVTWCLWNGLDHYGVRDVVNAANWQGGYTGTMLEHGKQVQHQENWLVGDAVIYGSPGSVGRHTAIIVDPDAGLCISHGSEGGPYLVKWNYRSDVLEIRRYI